jgi:hypothetical protein
VASVKDFPDALEALKDDLAREYRDQTCPIILAMMRNECPVDTGVLRQQHSIDTGLRKVNGGYLIRFRATPYWGVFVSEGHGVIRPVRAKALRFVTKQGKVVFTRKVRAVGPNPWMYRTFVRAGLSNAKRVFR